MSSHSGVRLPRRFGVWVALVLVVGGCSPEGGDGVASTSTETMAARTTTTTRPEPGEAVAAFVSCMGRAGLEIPEIRLDASAAPLLGDLLGEVDPGDPAVREALTVCAGPLAAAGVLDVTTDPELRRAVVDRLETYSACMRREGITGFPDPIPGFDGSGLPYPPEQVPSGSLGFDEAAAVCAAEAAGAPGEG